MSVPSWDRELSKAQFVYEAYRMCVEIGHIVASQPKKYRQNYGDILIHDSLECLKYCRLANAIFMNENTRDEDYYTRRNHLEKARSLAYHVSSVADVFLTLCYDGAKKDKIERQQRRIGTAASEVRNLISGVLKSDRKIRSGNHR